MKNKNIYANTIAEYEAKKLLSKQSLTKIANAQFCDAFKFLVSHGYLSERQTLESYDIDRFIAMQKDYLKNFVLENASEEALSKFLLNRPDFSEHSITELLKENIKNAKELGSNFEKFLKHEIDIINILSFHRAKKIGYSSEEIKEELIEGGEISTEEFDVKGSDFEDILALLNDGKLNEVRRRSNELALDAFSDGFNDFSTYDPFVKYFFEKLFEIRLVNYILVCLKYNIKAEINYGT